jgi:hypothetical protein
MDYIPTPINALRALIEALGPKKRAALSPAIHVLEMLVEPPKTSGPGSAWRDPIKGAAARTAMSASWAARRARGGGVGLQATWRSTGRQEICTSYEEVAKLVGRAAHTVRIYLSKGKGVAHFAHDDDIITIQRR